MKRVMDRIQQNMEEETQAAYKKQTCHRETPINMETDQDQSMIYTHSEGNEGELYPRS